MTIQDDVIGLINYSSLAPIMKFEVNSICGPHFVFPLPGHVTVNMVSFFLSFCDADTTDKV